MSVGKLLTVVIVLPFADAQGCEGDIDISGLEDIKVGRAGGGSKAEVVGYDR